MARACGGGKRPWRESANVPPPFSKDDKVTRKVSFPPVAAPDARVLILGSLPGDRSLAEQRYYAHPQNQFWRLLSPVIGQDLAALPYQDRLAALQQARIALWDVVATATRPGSTDASIRNPATNDLALLLDRLPDLRAIAFNGGKALALGKPIVKGCDMAILALPSSSALHTIGLAAKQPTWNMIADHLK